MIRSPRIKRLKKIGLVSIWLVNGNFIRSHINEEFTNFGQHFHFSFIPKNEFWIDKENKPDELDFFIHHLLIEHRLMKNGADYDQAIAEADKIEQRLRYKSQLVQKLLPKINHRQKILQKIRLRLLKNIALIRSLFG